jgi:glyoxylate/hydroxypyruvate reductase
VALLFYSSVLSGEAWVRALRAESPELDIRLLPDIGDPDEIDCVLSWRPPPGTFARLKNLRLVYGTGAGVDQLLADPELPPDVPIVRVVDDAQTDDMVAFVLAIVLGWHRKLDVIRAQQAAKLWSRPPFRSVRDVRVGVMGLGALGRATAERLAMVGFDVAGWNRSPRDIPGVEVHHGPDGLGAFLARTECLIVLLPLTDATRDILNADLFARLPPGAYLVSVGRGPHLVEADLLRALDQGQLSGATLDVFREEPLPQDHLFWTHPKITVTPHVASLASPESVAKQIVENLRRLYAGEPLLNQIDRVAGY